MKPKTLADLTANPPEGWTYHPWTEDGSGFDLYWMKPEAPDRPPAIVHVWSAERRDVGVAVRETQDLDELEKAHEAVAALLRALKEVL